MRAVFSVLKKTIKKILRKNPAVWNSLFYCVAFFRVYRKKGWYFLKYLFYRSKIKYIYEQRYAGKAIGVLPTDDAIGVLIFWTEYAIRNARLHGYDLKKDVVFIVGESCANDTYLDLLSNTITIKKDPEFHRLLFYSDGIRFLKKKDLLVSFRFLRDSVVFSPDATESISFSKEENQRGEMLLRNLGIEKGSVFVTIHNKDAYFYTQIGKVKAWDTYRDSSFEMLLPTVEYLREQGYRCVRMGHYQDIFVNGDVPYISLNQIQDKEDRQFLDFYLQSQAAFSICGVSGIAHIPWQFKKMILTHNRIPLGWSNTMDAGIFIPKLIWNKKTGQWVTLKELLSYTVVFPILGYHLSELVELTGDMFMSSDFYDLYHLEPVENSEEEILLAIKESLLYREGLLVLTVEQELRDQRFRSNLPINHPIRLSKALISPSFLEKYEHVFCSN